MPQPSLLLARLEAIGQSLSHDPQALALIGLGSVGLERDRIDAYSDLDFFAIVADGAKAAFIDDLHWLSSIHPVVYQFRNSIDGYKLLFADDIFCEFAVFELSELAGIPFAPGQIVWKRPEIPETISAPSRPAASATEKSPDFLLGEALTNLYVGLGRYHRGEKLSAARFIQGYAVDRIVELSALFETPQPGAADPFTPERRYEQRFPQTAQLMPTFMQGYDRTPESAVAILSFLEQHTEVNPQLAQRIRTLATEGAA